MSEIYRVRPSELVGIESKYWAYCFDEACANIIVRLRKEETPRFDEDAKENPLLEKMLSGAY